MYHAEHVGRTDLLLLHTSSLTLASRQQLPHGCTAAALSPNSCCLASLHQPDSHLASTQPAADLQQPLLQAVNTDPHVSEPPQQEASLDDAMLTDIADNAQASANLPRHRDLGAEQRHGMKTGQKQQSQDMRQTTIVCFHSLPTEALAEQSQSVPEHRALLEGAVSVKAEGQAGTTEAKKEMLTESVGGQGSDATGGLGSAMQVGHMRN